jgi:hypothetical protein
MPGAECLRFASWFWTLTWGSVIKVVNPAILPSRQDYALCWQPLDEVLYRLCRDHPYHVDCGAVNAKLCIIGRTYTTGIER